jgi:hypothetical protein
VAGAIGQPEVRAATQCLRQYEALTGVHSMESAVRLAEIEEARWHPALAAGVVA